MFSSKHLQRRTSGNSPAVLFWSGVNIILGFSDNTCVEQHLRNKAIYGYYERIRSPLHTSAIPWTFSRLLRTGPLYSLQQIITCISTRIWICSLPWTGYTLYSSPGSTLHLFCNCHFKNVISFI